MNWLQLLVTLALLAGLIAWLKYLDNGGGDRGDK